MSQSPHAAHLRNGQKMGDLGFVDTMIKDGLWDAFHGYHMGQTAENIASRWQITRGDQDTFAVASQNKAEAAQKAGKFDAEIVAVTIKGRKGDTIVDKDEFIRHGVTIDAISGLRPAFNKEGSVTAANASGLNDGAAALVLMSADEAKKRGLTPLARIASWANAGVEPEIMGTGPIPASKKALEKAGWTVADLVAHIQHQHVASSAHEGVGLSEIMAQCTDWDPSTTPDWFDSVVHQDVAHVETLPFAAASGRMETVYPHEEPLREWKIQAFIDGGSMTLEIVTVESWAEYARGLLDELADVAALLVGEPQGALF